MPTFSNVATQSRPLLNDRARHNLHALAELLGRPDLVEALPETLSLDDIEMYAELVEVPVAALLARDIAGDVSQARAAAQAMVDGVTDHVLRGVRLTTII